MADMEELYSRLTEGKASVLLVDDDPNILDTGKDILEDAGFDVVTAPTGGKAVALLEKKLFNVVVVDFQLPDITGLELARKVRERSDHTYVILMTGHASLEMAVKAIQEAVYDYLIKPVDPAQLQRTITRALDKQKLVLENRRLLTDLKQTNEAMARLDSLKSKMMTVLSHDLKTPLASIRGYSELLKSKGRLNESQQRMTEIMIQEADNLNGLIGDLLDLAKIDGGNLNLELSPAGFELIAHKALSRVKMMSEMREIPLDVTLPSPLPHVEVDSVRIVQVIANLLRAALKQSKRGGHVLVTGMETGGTVDLKITYAGQGFTDENLKSIFEWRRAAGQPHGSQDGLRIALAIGREILRAHRGEIGVESRGEDQGATFWLRLPKYEMKPDAQGDGSTDKDGK